MKFSTPILLIFTSLFAALPANLSADEVPEKILFVGNSYTGGIKREVQRFFAASPHRDIAMTFINPGGLTLERHLANAKTIEMIKTGDWDLVVLQEQSQTPAYGNLRRKFVKAAVELDKVIKSSGARTLFYQTWGRRDGDKRNIGLAPDYKTMQDLLTAGYAEAADKTDGNIAPVGEAWRLVWKADAELAKSLYQRDGSHPSSAGAYLAACVFYIKMTGSDPDDVDYRGSLPEETAAILRRAAKQAATQK